MEGVRNPVTLLNSDEGTGGFSVASDTPCREIECRYVTCKIHTGDKSIEFYKNIQQYGYVFS